VGCLKHQDGQQQMMLRKTAEAGAAERFRPVLSWTGSPQTSVLVKSRTRSVPILNYSQVKCWSDAASSWTEIAVKACSSGWCKNCVLNEQYRALNAPGEEQPQAPAQAGAELLESSSAERDWECWGTTG